MNDYDARVTALFECLHRFARTLVRDSAMADDLAAEAVYRGVRRGVELQICNFNWFAELIKNLVRDDHRHRAVENKYVDSHQPVSTSSDCGVTENEEAIIAMLQAIDKLPPEQHEFILSWRFAKMSLQDIADMQQRSLYTIRILKTAALANLAVILRRMGFDLDS